MPQPLSRGLTELGVWVPGPKPCMTYQGGMHGPVMNKQATCTSAVACGVLSRPPVMVQSILVV